MTSPRRPSSERDRLIQACIEVVGEVGYAQAQTEAMALRAGLDLDVATRHFASKDDLFLATWEAVQQRFSDSAISTFAAGDSWRESVRALGEACLRFIQESPREARVVAEGRNGDERVRERFEAMANAIVDLVDLGRQELEDPDSLTRATAEGIAGAVYEQVTRQFSRPDGFDDLPSLLPNLMFLIVRPYLGIEAATEELTRQEA